MEEENSYVII